MSYQGDGRRVPDIRAHIVKHVDDWLKRAVPPIFETEYAELRVTIYKPGRNEDGAPMVSVRIDELGPKV